MSTTDNPTVPALNAYWGILRTIQRHAAHPDTGYIDTEAFGHLTALLRRLQLNIMGYSYSSNVDPQKSVLFTSDLASTLVALVRRDVVSVEDAERIMAELAAQVGINYSFKDTVTRQNLTLHADQAPLAYHTPTMLQAIASIDVDAYAGLDYASGDENVLRNLGVLSSLFKMFREGYYLNEQNTDMDRFLSTLITKGHLGINEALMVLGTGSWAGTFDTAMRALAGDPELEKKMAYLCTLALHNTVHHEGEIARSIDVPAFLDTVSTHGVDLPVALSSPVVAGHGNVHVDAMVANSLKVISKVIYR
jgi:hypothetical protein